MKALCCVMFLGVSALLLAADVQISNLPGNAKISRMGMNSKDRTNNKYGASITAVPEMLNGLQMISVPRGVGNAPTAGYSFTIDKPATVYMLVEDHGKVDLSKEWKLEKDQFVKWKYNMAEGRDFVYSRQYPAGKVEIPVHNGHDPSRYAIPNAALIKAEEPAAAEKTTGAGEN